MLTDLGAVLPLAAGGATPAPAVDLSRDFARLCAECERAIIDAGSWWVSWDGGVV